MCMIYSVPGRLLYTNNKNRTQAIPHTQHTHTRARARTRSLPHTRRTTHTRHTTHAPTRTQIHTHTYTQQDVLDFC